VLLEDPAQDLTRGTDVRIYLTQKVAGGYWVNGEVERVSRDRRSLIIRLNHVKPRPE